MRSFAFIAIAGSLLLASSIQAQTLTEHAAAAAGATIGTAGGKGVSNAITKIFGQVDETTKKAAGKKVETAAPAKPASAAPAAVPSFTATSTGTPVRRKPRALASDYESTATVNTPVLATRIAEEPLRKEPTAEELASIKVGATEKDLLAALGAPASRVTIPEEGHLLEICQYWAKGKPLGTVRLDNGQVVTVEPRTDN